MTSVTLVFINVNKHFHFWSVSDSIRGRLGSVFILAFGSGVLFAYICGTFISYTTLPYVYSCFSLLFLIGTLFHPDSPFFILQRLKDDEVRCAKIHETVRFNYFSLFLFFITLSERKMQLNSSKDDRRQLSPIQTMAEKLKSFK